MTTVAPTISLNKAVQPFYFNTSDHLLRVTAFKAGTLKEFQSALRACPDESIFQHTFRTLQEHHFIEEGFVNDFANWVLTACDAPDLAKQLASVDIRDFTSLPDLRERFIQIVDGYLKSASPPASCHAEKTFYFCASDIIVMPTKFVAGTLPDFLKGLREVSIHSIHHHFIESRLRLKLISNDFFAVASGN
jgi:hypothetical protein